MSISALGSVTPGASVAAAPARTAGFQPQMAALGHGHAAHGPRAPGTGTAAPAASLADDTRALVGDVFGALGANTPSQASARQAVEAYRRTS
jgi:Spy/CpxP family protein refolding chaperone